MTQGKKPKIHIGSTRAAELSSLVAREKASSVGDPYGMNLNKPQFKMKRFADIQSKLDVLKLTRPSNATDIIGKNRPGHKAAALQTDSSRGAVSQSPPIPQAAAASAGNRTGSNLNN